MTGGAAGPGRGDVVRLLPVGQLAAHLRQRWAAARVWAAHQAPYLSSALLALDPVVVDQSAAGDRPPPYDLRRLPADPRWHVYLDPAVLAALEVPAIGFWLLHQVTHLLRDHAGRYPGAGSGDRGPLAGRSADSVRWNIAGDAEIDDDLVAGAVELPPDAVTPGRLGLPEGWTAEQYWDALGGASRFRPDPASRGWQGGDCGSGCDCRCRGWDCDRPGLGRLGSELVRREVAQRIRSSRSRGDLPAGWRRWAEELLAPTVDWRRQLAAAVRHGVAEVSGRVDFTYRRPSRRASAVPEVVLPSLRQPSPQVAVVMDTSDRLAQALGEVNGVLRGVGLGRRNLRVICCDARAYQAQRVFDAREVRLTGGGGTDMGAGLAAAVALRPRPDIVVVLTDGHTPWPSKPSMRVVVGLMDPSGRSPDWAVTVQVGPALAGRR
jgi:predicted metal-dependent peptidase